MNSSLLVHGLDCGDFERNFPIWVLNHLNSGFQVLDGGLGRKQSRESTCEDKALSLKERAFYIQRCQFPLPHFNQKIIPQSPNNDGMTFTNSDSMSIGFSRPEPVSSSMQSRIDSACEPIEASAASSGLHLSKG